jgi:hypothetical protein
MQWSRPTSLLWLSPGFGRMATFQQEHLEGACVGESRRCYCRACVAVESSIAENRTGAHMSRVLTLLHCGVMLGGTPLKSRSSFIELLPWHSTLKGVNIGRGMALTLGSGAPTSQKRRLKHKGAVATTVAYTMTQSTTGFRELELVARKTSERRGCERARTARKPRFSEVIVTGG